MNEQIENKLNEFVNKTINAVEDGAGFLSEQLPDYINQLLLWYATYNGILCILGFVIIGSVYYVGKRLSKHEFKYSSDAESAWVAYLLVSIFLIALSLVALINIKWLQIILAPKVWLVEYAAKLAG